MCWNGVRTDHTSNLSQEGGKAKEERVGEKRKGGGKKRKGRKEKRGNGKKKGEREGGKKGKGGKKKEEGGEKEERGKKRGETEKKRKRRREKEESREEKGEPKHLPVSRICSTQETLCFQRHCSCRLTARAGRALKAPPALSPRHPLAHQEHFSRQMQPVGAAMNGTGKLGTAGTYGGPG